MRASKGRRFAVWAPNAIVVSVVGDFNGWDTRQNPTRARTGGVWETWRVPRHALQVRHNLRGYSQQKADPFGFWMEKPPKSATLVADLAASPGCKANLLDHPVSVYEVHLGSWMRDSDNQPLSYRELELKLVPYVKEMGYTDIELMPIA